MKEENWRIKLNGSSDYHKSPLPESFRLQEQSIISSYLASKFSLLLDAEHNWACLGSEVVSEESLWRNINLMETRWWRRQKAADTRRVGSFQQLVVRREIFSRLSSNKPASKLLTHACSATSHSYWSSGHTQHQITPESTFPVEFLNFDIIVHPYFYNIWAYAFTF